MRIFSLITLSLLSSFAWSQSTAQATKTDDTCCSKEQLKLDEETADEQLKSARKRSDLHRREILTTGSNTKVWNTFTINSDARDVDHLTAPIERKSGFQMTLAPSIGKVTFSEGITKHTFEIGKPQNTKDNLASFEI